MKKLAIGLFGFGVVGEGIYRILKDKPELNTHIRRVCIRHPEKARNAPREIFTTEADVILNDPQIDIVVELIDDANAAFHICSTALRKGKAVVSANKRMIAENLPELLAIQKQCQVPFLYEGAVCGSIPVIRNLEAYFDHDRLLSVAGIVNGSTNYILSQMSLNGHSYDEILDEARELGFAESDPTLDVEGIDAAYKLSLILFHAFGVLAPYETIPRRGIASIHPFDMHYAREKGLRIKLIAGINRINKTGYSAFVLPQFVDPSDKLFHVNHEYNAVVISSSLADEQFLSGKGAGRFPTASAVLSDIHALKHGYRYAYRKFSERIPLHIDHSADIYFYVSIPTGKTINTEVFDHLHERFTGPVRSYVAGTTTLEKIHRAEWWDDSEVSVIKMNR